MQSNNETNVTIEDVPLPEEKVKRRSSIFRPAPLETVSVDYKNETDSNYNNKLIQEIKDWKTYYAKKKLEYMELRSSNTQPEYNTDDIYSKCKDFPEMCDNFVSKVNTALEMHKHLLVYKRAKIEILQKIKEETDAIIKKKANFKN